MKQLNGLMIPIDDIFPDPAQPRQHFPPEAIDRMAASVKNRGILQPLRVRRDAQRNAWLLVSGECRWRAAKQVGLSAVPALPIEQEMSETDILSDQLIENICRDELKPLELARSLAKLLKLKGTTAEKLADELGISGASVSRAIKLLTLPEDIQAQIDDGSISADSGYHISRLPDEAAQRILAEDVASGRITRNGVAEAVQKVIPKKDVKPTPERATYRLDGGVTVTVSATTTLTFDLLLAAIEQIRRQADALKKKDKGIGDLAASLTAPAHVARKAKPAKSDTPVVPLKSG